METRTENMAESDTESCATNSEQSPEINALGPINGTESAPTSLQKQSFSRKGKRRRDLRSIDGIIREHERLLNKMADEKVTLNKGDILGRGYNRQFMMLHAKAMVEAMHQLTYEIREARLSKSGGWINGQVFDASLAELLE